MSEYAVRLSFNGKEAAIGLDAHIKKFNLDADKFVRAFATQIMERIVRRMPVDTGNARSNWRPSLDAEDLQYNERTDGSAASGDEVASNIAAMYAKGTMKNVFWMCNSTPYIQALENGHSKQAPVGMVALTFSEAEHFYNKTAETVFKAGVR